MSATTPVRSGVERHVCCGCGSGDSASASVRVGFCAAIAAAAAMAAASAASSLRLRRPRLRGTTCWHESAQPFSTHRAHGTCPSHFFLSDRHVKHTTAALVASSLVFLVLRFLTPVSITRTPNDCSSL
jgi:hypothetical protein